MRASFTNYRDQGRVFESVDAVRVAARELLDEFAIADSTDHVQLTIERRGKNWADCFVQRGRFRVGIHGLPDWMHHEWEALAAAEASQDGAR